ncbi:hypothetical protein AALB16_15090 [Lachnospiraceae bacterium 62-35]
MTVQQLIDKEIFHTVNPGNDMGRDIEAVYCCDLLSIAMGRAPSGCAWVTVMANLNTLAVASLADAACVIMAEGVKLDEMALKKAAIEGICVLETEEPVFQAALKVHESMNGF